MSASIPSDMLLSDLLKATGYNCPDDLTALKIGEKSPIFLDIILY